MKTYIYILQHPITQEVRYVGKTTNLKRRYYQYVSIGTINKSNTHVSKWCLSLYNQKLKPLMICIDEIDDEIDNDWQSLEQYWISQFKTWGFDLCNHTKGGEGFGHKHSEESKKKMSKSQKGKPKIFSEESKEVLRKRFKENNPRIDERFKNKWYENLVISRSFCKTEEFKNKQKIAHRNRLISYPPPRGIKVINTITGEIFNSIKDAAESINIKSYNLRRYLSGKIKNKTSLKYYEK